MLDYDLILAKNHKLQTKRLLLRPLTLADTEDLYEISSHEKVTMMTGYSTHQTLADTEQAIAHYFMKRPLGKYGIELRTTGKLIGTIDLRLTGPNSGELGYQMNPNYQRKGYTFEAAETLLEFGFEKLHLHRLTAKCLAFNLPSQALLEKLGMKKEGVLRQAEKRNGKYVDMYLFSRLKEDN